MSDRMKKARHATRRAGQPMSWLLWFLFVLGLVLAALT